MKMDMNAVLLFILLILVFVVIVTALFQYLWNSTMPELFKLSHITFWEAFRLLLIAAMLFGVGGIININVGG